ncbi:hypothetical protein BFS86_18910 [Shewanella algae]|nr:hypothetical protein BFS86_18910 [Shewanella algae]
MGLVLLGQEIRHLLAVRSVKMESLEGQKIEEVAQVLTFLLMATNLMRHCITHQKSRINNEILKV